jgi:hypothetical protein
MIFPVSRYLSFTSGALEVLDFGLLALVVHDEALEFNGAAVVGPVLLLAHLTDLY